MSGSTALKMETFVDIISPNFVEVLNDVMEKSGCDVVQCDLTRFTEVTDHFVVSVFSKPDE